MPNQSGKIVLILALIILLAGAAVYFFIPSLKNNQNSEQILENTRSSQIAQKDTSKQYSSQDLKMSFEHPRDWFVQEKNYFIMITSFQTKFSANQQPNERQIEIDIHDYNGGCHETIDENLKDPACGEGGPSVKPNEILSKIEEEVNGGKFYTYNIQYPNGQKKKVYFLEKGDRILQIDKNPDPSQFENEFKQIVESIKFQ